VERDGGRRHALLQHAIIDIKVEVLGLARDGSRAIPGEFFLSVFLPLSYQYPIFVDIAPLARITIAYR
jgi:hypothetical protein